MPIVPPAPALTAPIFTPFGDQYQPVQPYISVSEYINSAEAVSTDDLIPGGSEAQQISALASKILIAAGWANRICHQSLVATLNNETVSQLFRRSDGNVWVNVRYWPIQQVNSCSLGGSPSSLSAVASPDIWQAGRTTLVIPAAGGSGSTVNFGAPLPSGGSGGYLMGSVQYVTGWPQARLTADAHAGDTILYVSNTLAFRAGGYRIFDKTSATETVAGGIEEDVSVGGVGTGILNLTAPLLYDHLIPTLPDCIFVSSMPENIRQGNVHLTSQSIKSRGAEAVILAQIGGNHTQAASQGGFEDLASAMDLLAYYDRVSLG